MKFAANMAYRVELTARAASDLEALYLEKNVAESPDAARWYNGLEQAVYTLEFAPSPMPECPGSAQSQAATAASPLRRQAPRLPRNFSSRRAATCHMGAHDSPRGKKTTKVSGFGLIFKVEIHARRIASG
jgi:hypothetical protein